MSSFDSEDLISVRCGVLSCILALDGACLSAIEEFTRRTSPGALDQIKRLVLSERGCTVVNPGAPQPPSIPAPTPGNPGGPIVVVPPTQPTNPSPSPQQPGSPAAPGKGIIGRIAKLVCAAPLDDIASQAGATAAAAAFGGRTLAAVFAGALVAGARGAQAECAKRKPSEPPALPAGDVHSWITAAQRSGAAYASVTDSSTVAQLGSLYLWRPGSPWNTLVNDILLAVSTEPDTMMAMNAPITWAAPMEASQNGGIPTIPGLNLPPIPGQGGKLWDQPSAGGGANGAGGGGPSSPFPGPGQQPSTTYDPKLSGEPLTPGPSIPSGGGGPSTFETLASDVFTDVMGAASSGYIESQAADIGSSLAGDS